MATPFRSFGQKLTTSELKTGKRTPDPSPLRTAAIKNIYNAFEKYKVTIDPAKKNNPEEMTQEVPNRRTTLARNIRERNITTALKVKYIPMLSIPWEAAYGEINVITVPEVMDMKNTAMVIDTADFSKIPLLCLT